MNRQPKTRCLQCGYPIRGVIGKSIWTAYIRYTVSPHGMVHGGEFAGFIHKRCPEHEPPKEGTLSL